jgi:hypothetical protein
MKIIYTIITSLLLFSCATHQTKITELKNSRSNYLASFDATKRGSIISFKENGEIDKILSEVQPDAVIASTIDFTNKLSITDKLTSDQIVKITESLTTLGERTANVNILRDALYRMEEHCVNFKEHCDKETYWKNFDSVISKITGLIEKQNQGKKLDNDKLDKELQLKNYDHEYDARTNYQTAIKFLIEQDEKNSINYFKLLYEKYPSHFNIDEINKELIKMSKNGMNDKKWKELYKFITNGRLWRIDENLQKLLIEKSK